MTVKELKDGTPFIKANYWEGGDLKGTWLATYKIDGLRVIRGKDNKVYSRDSKEAIHDLAKFKFNDAEFFYKDWNTSVSILHTQEETIPITQDMFYELSQGNEDPRLVIGRLVDPTEETINALLKKALLLKHEGIVLRFLGSKTKWLKVVPTRYADIRITAINEGKGKYAGVAGSLVTAWGNVGSFELQPNMTDIEFRKELFLNQDKYLGKIAQVAYREITKNYVLKFPRLSRIRDDKDYEDLPEEFQEEATRRHEECIKARKALNLFDDDEPEELQ